MVYTLVRGIFAAVYTTTTVSHIGLLPQSRQNLEKLCLHFITKPILYQGCGDKGATSSNDGLMMDFVGAILPNAAE